MKEIWIIGAGRFGRMAADRLTGKIKNLHLVLVDLEAEKLHGVEGPGRSLIRSDGAAYLATHLKGGEPRPDWIVPAVPIHLAAEWRLLDQGAKNLQRIPIPAEMDPLLPHPLRVPNGNIFVSHADFLCPDDCAEPHNTCTFTGKPRKQNMFELLGDIQFPPWKSLVIRSHQLGPGVGGYRTQELFDLAEQIEKTRGPLLLSTACRCHGVITGLRLNRA
ncbi:MAG: potassium transporter [Deltaproteobacteria bacterium]|nr:potassium transporter [Deltaproteobacteria bacterium]